MIGASDVASLGVATGFFLGLVLVMLSLSIGGVFPIKPPQLKLFSLAAAVSSADIFIVRGLTTLPFSLSLIGSVATFAAVFLSVYVPYRRRFRVNQDGSGMTMLGLSSSLSAASSSNSPGNAHSSEQTNQMKTGPLVTGFLLPSDQAQTDPATRTPSTVAPVEHPSPPVLAAPYAKVPLPTSGHPALNDDPETGRSPGMFVAANLLIVNSLLSLLELSLLTQQGGTPAELAPRPVVFLVDLLIAFMLLRGRLRTLALIRSLVGGLFFSGLALLVYGLDYGLVFVAAQAALTSGLLLLLAGKTRNPIRLGAGVMFALTAWTTLFAYTFVLGYTGDSATVAHWSLPQRSYVGDEFGVRLDLPSGWMLLSSKNPEVSSRFANAVVYHSATGCYAMLIIQPALARFSNVDHFSDMIVRQRQARNSTAKETGRDRIIFGGLDGRRVYSRWESGGRQYSGFATAGADSLNYFLLLGWNSSSKFRRSLYAFKELEKGFKITAAADVRLDSVARDLAADLTYISRDAAKRIIVRMVGDGVPDEKFTSTAVHPV